MKEMRRWVRRHITVGEVCDGAYRGEEGVVWLCILSLWIGDNCKGRKLCVYYKAFALVPPLGRVGIRRGGGVDHYIVTICSQQHSV